MMVFADLGSLPNLSDGQGTLVTPADRTILNSWKEIATYMGRGVRTVQRWERHFHLPVHRPSGEPRSAVLAFSDEVDQWLAATPLANGGGHPTTGGLPKQRGLPPRTRELVASVRSRTVTLVRAAEKLQRNVMRAQAQQQRWREKEPA
jgi:hypothetical protein